MSDNKRILIVEDDASIAELLKYNLIKNNFNVDYVSHGLDIVENVIQFNSELILLDLMLPEKDGFEICK